MPLSAAWCRRPRRFRTVFSVAFTVRFVTFSVVMGDGKGAWFPCRNELHAEEASHDHPEDGPGPTDSDVPVPLSPAKSR